MTWITNWEKDFRGRIWVRPLHQISKTVLCSRLALHRTVFDHNLPGNPPILSQLGIFVFPPQPEGRISTRLRRIFLGNIEPLINKALSLQCVFVDKYLPASSVGNLYTPQNLPPFQAKIRHCKPLSDIFSVRNEKACTVGFLLCWYHID